MRDKIKTLLADTWTLLKIMAIAAVVFAMIGGIRMERAEANAATIYDVWAEPGLHLMMSDNGTPENFEDDWVVDWEDNRAVAISITN